MDQGKIDQLFIQAEELEAKGEQEIAIELYEKILEMDPANHLVKLRLISIYSKIGENEKVKGLQDEVNSSLQKAKEMRDEDLKIESMVDSLIEGVETKKASTVNNLESMVDTLIDEIDECIQEIKTEISEKVKGPQPVIIYPDRPKIIIDGNVYEDRKKTIKAKYDEILQLFNSNQFQETLIQSKELLKLDRKFAPAWFIIGAVYGKIQDFRKALVYFQKAVELDSKNDQYLAWLSWVFGKLRYYKKSLNVAKKAVKLNVENASAWQNMGFAFKVLNEPRKALWCFIHTNSIREDEIIVKQIKELESAGVEPFNPLDKELKLCHRCGSEVRINAKFCDTCGTSLEIIEKEEKWKDESIKDCLICKKKIVKEKPVVCKTCHFTFHRECLLRWVEVHKRCPNCGNEVGWI